MAFDETSTATSGSRRSMPNTDAIPNENEEITLDSLSQQVQALISTQVSAKASLKRVNWGYS